MTTVRFRHFPPTANAIACLLFVLLREPVADEYLAEREAVHRYGGIYLHSGITGTIACRILYSWSEWHGGEALGVKMLEILNAPAAIAVGVTGIAGLFGVAAALVLQLDVGPA